MPPVCVELVGSVVVAPVEPPVGADDCFDPPHPARRRAAARTPMTRRVRIGAAYSAVVSENRRMQAIAPGLRRWTAWHDHWEEDVGALALETGDGLVLFDPIEPPPDLREPGHVLLTVYWHGRSTGTLAAKRVWASTRSNRPLENRGISVTDPFRAGDALPGGVQAFQTARSAEVVFWLPDQRAVVVGDVLLGAGAKPGATDDPLRLCPERWLGKATHEDLRETLRPLLDLPVERVVVSHGAPILEEAHAVLEGVLI
jgi:hypothetical protein